MQQPDVVGYNQVTARLVPTRTVAQQHGVGARLTWVLISARCRFIISVFAAGVIIAAPTPRCGQMAPKM